MGIRKILSIVLLSVTSIHAYADGVADRAAFYNKLFLGGNPANYLDVNIKPTIPGTRNVLTVLPGVLYRGGGAGGQHPLKASTLMELCRDGFSLAVYAYTVGYKNPGVISCTTTTGQPNELRYIAGSANTPDFKETFLREVQQVISNPQAGPIFEHCWNGDHASGELAAVALRQFCGWSAQNANTYWLRHASGAPLISRIGKFTPLGGLSVPGNQMDTLCAQRK